jgi:hypothetical protein
MTPISNRLQIPRRGVSRISVLVVLGIFVLAGMLSAAAIVRAREDSRRLQCLCRIKMIGLAIQNYASGSGGLPPLTGLLPIKSDVPHKVEGQLIVPWLVHLLPALDEAELWRKVRANASSGLDPTSYRIDESEQVTLAFLNCPEAPPRASGLNYVLNTGFIARELYQGDPDRKHRSGSLRWAGATEGNTKEANVQLVTGIFWHDRSVSLDDISTGDGVTTTLMLTENLQAGRWFDLNTTRIAFAFPVANTSGRVSSGAKTIFESAQDPLRTRSTELSSYTPRDWRINDDRTANTGTRPRPSSNHAFPGINVMMCDGSGRYIGQKIDPQVYLKLMTWNGAAFGEQQVNHSEY